MKQYRIKALKGRHKTCLTRSSKIIFTLFSAQKIVNPPSPRMPNLNSGRSWQASAATRKWLQSPSTACRTTRIFFFICRQRLRWPRPFSFSKPTLPNGWMNEHGRRFAWQEGYGGFSVSVSNTATVAKYIRDQQLHHRKMTFEQEYRALLKKHGIDPDAL
jgi:hypothetical protein